MLEARTNFGATQEFAFTIIFKGYSFMMPYDNVNYWLQQVGSLVYDYYVDLPLDSTNVSNILMHTFKFTLTSTRHSKDIHVQINKIDQWFKFLLFADLNRTFGNSIVRRWHHHHHPEHQRVANLKQTLRGVWFAHHIKTPAMMVSSYVLTVFLGFITDSYYCE